MADINTIEQQLQTAIAQQETGGGTAGVGLSLHNPGALRYADWEANYGATSDASGFAKFPTVQAGYDAMLSRIKQLVGSGVSLTSLINTWAPASDGNTNNAARISQLATTTGLDATASIQSQTSGSDASWFDTVFGSASAATAASAAAAAATTATGGIGGSTVARIAVGVSGLILLTIGLCALALTNGVTVVNGAIDNAGTVGKGIKGAASLAAAV